VRVVIFPRDDDALQLHAACETERDDTEFILATIFNETGQNPKETLPRQNDNDGVNGMKQEMNAEL